MNLTHSKEDPARMWLTSIFIAMYLIYVIQFSWFGIQYFKYEKRFRHTKSHMYLKYITLFVSITILTGFVIYGFGRTMSSSKSSDYTVNESKTSCSISSTYLDDELTTGFDLNDGDQIELSLILTNGKLNVTIAMENEPPVFEYHSTNSHSSTITVHKTGHYIVTCKGDDVEGNFHFKVK